MTVYSPVTRQNGHESTFRCEERGTGAGDRGQPALTTRAISAVEASSS